MAKTQQDVINETAAVKSMEIENPVKALYKCSVSVGLRNFA